MYELVIRTPCPDGLIRRSIRVFACFLAPVTFLNVKFLVVTMFPIDLLDIGFDLLDLVFEFFDLIYYLQIF
jgi:hypothetical protein